MRIAPLRRFVAPLLALWACALGAASAPNAGISTPTSTGTPSPAPALSPAAAAAGLSAVAAPVSPAAASLSGSASALSPTAATPAPTPTSTPVPVALPQAPQALAWQFVVLTPTAKTPAPAVNLKWEAADPGDYLVKGYRIYRATHGAAEWQRVGMGPADASGTAYTDPEPVGALLDYKVSAVDSRGVEGPSSEAVTADLQKLPAAALAPPAPRDVTATSRRYDVRLHWRKAPDWIAEWSAYRVYRATTVAGLKGGFLASVTVSADDPYAVTTTAQGLSASAQALSGTPGAPGAAPQGASGTAQPSFLGDKPSPTATPGAGSFSWFSGSDTPTPVSGSATALSGSAAALSSSAQLRPTATPDGFYFYDSPPASAVDYYYAVTSLDVSGHESPLGVTLSGRATGTLAPALPAGLTATPKTERVDLEWKASAPGTAPISAYLLHRREADAEHWRKVAFLNASTTAYTDSVDGGSYVYRLAAVDTEGNTGEAAYVGATPSAKIMNNTLILLMPTAYAGNPGRDTGVNLNVLFDFYVGSLYEDISGTATIFTPLEIGTMTADLKYAFLNDRGWVPGFAVGLYSTADIGFGSGTQSVGLSTSNGSLATMGDAYAVLSKHFMPSKPDAAIHAGLMIGKLADDLSQEPVPSWMWPTLHHLMPAEDFPDIFTKFVDPARDMEIAQSPNMAYFGFQYPFTVPLGFTRWRTGLRMEGCFPLQWGAEYEALPAGSSIATPTKPAADNLPYLINIHIDNLPLFGFEFGLFEFSNGYEVIAFYHIPDLSWAW